MHNRTTNTQKKREVVTESNGSETIQFWRAKSKQISLDVLRHVFRNNRLHAFEKLTWWDISCLAVGMRIAFLHILCVKSCRNTIISWVQYCILQGFVAKWHFGSFCFSTLAKDIGKEGLNQTWDNSTTKKSTISSECYISALTAEPKWEAFWRSARERGIKWKISSLHQPAVKLSKYYYTYICYYTNLGKIFANKGSCMLGTKTKWLFWTRDGYSNIISANSLKYSK